MACSTSEIVFWTVGGLVLIVLIGIGIAEICRKRGSSRSCSSSSSGGTQVDVDVIQNEGDVEVNVATADLEPAVRAGRVSAAAQIDTSQPSVAPTGDESIDEDVEIRMVSEFFGLTDGHAFKLGTAPQSKEQLKKTVTQGSSFGRNLTTSDSVTSQRPLSRVVGRAGNVAFELLSSKGCDGNSTRSLVDPGREAQVFHATDAYLSARAGR